VAIFLKRNKKLEIPASTPQINAKIGLSRVADRLAHLARRIFDSAAAEHVEGNLRGDLTESLSQLSAQQHNARYRNQDLNCCGKHDRQDARRRE
jgi:hypothetical protein